MMAEDTAKLMQTFSIEQAYVLGISMGGRIALALSLQDQERIKKLMLVSTSARRIKNWTRHFYWMLSSAPIFKSKYRQPHYALTRQRQASSVYDCTGKLHKLHIQTMIMHGKKDKTVPYTLAEEMHTGIQGSNMLTFAGGHLFFLMKERQRFLEAVTEFVK
jgi:pimeloyl-ACP methyl ester carboxylesterase